MDEPKHDNAAEQKARVEETKQEAEQLVELQRRKIFSPHVLPVIANAYFLFVGTLVAFGVLAFYSGHLTILKIVFVICIPLLLVVPIGAIWYLLAMFPKKPSTDVAPGKQSALDKMLQSPAGKTVARVLNSRIFKVFNFSLSIYMVTDAILMFPRHPRASLAIVASYTVSLSVLLTLSVVEKVENRHIGTMYGQLELTKKLSDMIALTYLVAESSRKYIEATEKSHREAHETTTVALKATNAAIPSDHSSVGEVRPPANEEDKGPDPG